MSARFTALGERLARRGVVADVFVVGGAAMAMAYDATRVTRDVDARFVPHGIVLGEAKNVADDLALLVAERASQRLYLRARMTRASAGSSITPGCA